MDVTVPGFVRRHVSELREEEVDITKAMMVLDEEALVTYEGKELVNYLIY